MKSREELHAYWRNPEPKNAPETYVNYPERTEYLVGLLKERAHTSESIMELGCNVGRNLKGLYDAGFSNLYGVEINLTALAMMLHTYPEVPAMVYTGAIEDLLNPNHLPACDVVFTMCVLMHLHPDSEWVFGEIANHTDTLITIEDEVKETWRHCPRNYKDVFEPFGLTQVFHEHVQWGENGCEARVFERVGKD